MAPPSKGKTAALGISSSSFVDHMRAFNVAVAEYKLAHAQQSTSRALADLEKILPVLTRISDPAGQRVHKVQAGACAAVDQQSAG